MPLLSTEVSPLLTVEVTKTLAKQGVRTDVDYVQRELVALSRVTNLPYKLLTNIRQCLLAQFAPLPSSAADIWREGGETTAILPTGCSNLDTLLGGGGDGGGAVGDEVGREGGIMTGELTELTGVPSSGKTQLCHSLTAAIVRGTSSTVLWVDSTAGFTASRLHSILSHQLTTHTAEEVLSLLEKVRVHRVFNLFDLLRLLHTTSHRISNQSDWFHSNLHLLVVDSVTPLLSPILGGHGGHGHALLSHLAAHLRSIACEHSIAVVYTNNTVADIGGGCSGRVKPSLGLSWSYVPHTRILLSLPSSQSSSTSSSTSLQPAGNSCKGEREEERIATLTKSSRLAVGVSTTFLISNKGILNHSTDS